MNKTTVNVFASEADQKFYRLLSLPEETISFHAFNDAALAIKGVQPDISLIDCGFDIEMGLKLLKEIKHHSPQTIIIFLTNTSSEEWAIQAYKSGVREYIRKPVDLLALHNLIIGLLRMKRSSKEKRPAFLLNEKSKPRMPEVSFEHSLPARIVSVIYYMRENLHRNISLQDCASNAQLSKYHFCRLFKKKIGMSPSKYLNLLRIERANILLINEDLNILEVAFEAGFTTYSSFLRNFKKITGTTPRIYRRLSIKTKKHQVKNPP